MTHMILLLSVLMIFPTILMIFPGVLNIPQCTTEPSVYCTGIIQGEVGYHVEIFLTIMI